MNITLTMDDEVVRKVRRIAAQRDTTLTAIVREHLEAVANSDAQARQERVRQLQGTFRRLSRPMGPRTWSRDDLHDR